MEIRKIILVLVVLLLTDIGRAYSQITRDVIIFKDQVGEYNKTGSDDVYIEKGVRIHLYDSTGKDRLQMVSYIKNNLEDGDTFTFDAVTNMLIAKESYKQGRLDGISYYWNKKGFLIRTEVWQNDKLISKKVYPVPK